MKKILSLTLILALCLLSLAGCGSSAGTPSSAPSSAPSSSPTDSSTEPPLAATPRPLKRPSRWR